MEITPTEAAIASPKDLDIANPGKFYPYSQTLFGPKYPPPPSQSTIGSTRPPILRILANS